MRAVHEHYYIIIKNLSIELFFNLAYIILIILKNNYKIHIMGNMIVYNLYINYFQTTNSVSRLLNVYEHKKLLELILSKFAIITYGHLNINSQIF